MSRSAGSSTASQAAWDGYLPWPTFPSALVRGTVPSIPAAATKAPAIAEADTSATFYRHLVGCQAVQLQQWSSLLPATQGLLTALAQGSAAKPQADAPQAVSHTNCPQAGPRAGLQPWAIPQGDQGQQTSGTKPDTSADLAPAATAAFEYGDISLSGRLKPSTTQLSNHHGPTSDMYTVRQTEWRELTLTTGTLHELVACMASWSSTRILATLDLASLTAPSHTQSHDTTGSPWLVQLDRTTASRLGPTGSQAAAQAMEAVAQWIPEQLLTSPITRLTQLLGCTAAGQPPPQEQRWTAANCKLRWWSQGATEPLNTCAADRLLLQVHGTTRVFVVPSLYALRGLAPFPTQHVYAGYSAPGVAVTARVPHPSKSPHPAPPSSGSLALAPDSKPANSNTAAATPAVDTCAGSASAAIRTSLDVLPSLQRPSEMYQHEERLLMDAAGELWPEFASVCGQAAVLRAGDALWVPAGWFVHLESLYMPPPSCDQHGSEATAQSHVQRPSDVPGNVMLEVLFTSSSVGIAPRDLGSLELRAAEVIEGWATQCVGTPARTRQLLIDLAHRLEAASYQLGLEDTPHNEPGEQQGGEKAGSSLSWVRWPSQQMPAVPLAVGGQPLPVEDDARARQQLKMLFRRDAGDHRDDGCCHWAALPSVDKYSLAAQRDTPQAAGHTMSWEPCWDPATLDGHRHIMLARQVLSTLAPLIALQEHTPALQQHQASKVTQPPEGTPCYTTSTKQPSWHLGSKAAAFLRGMCAGRLLPTTWLNKLAHNDALLLADTPYRYAIEFKSQDEADFPELFKPQLAKRERKAKAAAEVAHLTKLRLGSSKTLPPSLLTDAGSSR